PQIFRDRGINHVIISGTSREETTGIIARLLAQPEQWTPLYLDGRTSIFGWRDPAKKGSDPFAKLRFDLSSQAFGAEVTQAPLEGPGRAPEEQSWWQIYATAPRPGSLDADQAAIDLVYFEILRQQRRPQQQRTWMLVAHAGIFGAVNPGGGGLS